MKKRIFAILLATTLILSVSALAFASQANTSMDDYAYSASYDCCVDVEASKCVVKSYTDYIMNDELNEFGYIGIMPFCFGCFLMNYYFGWCGLFH